VTVKFTPEISDKEIILLDTCLQYTGEKDLRKSLFSSNKKNNFPASSNEHKRVTNKVYLLLVPLVSKIT